MADEDGDCGNGLRVLTREVIHDEMQLGDKRMDATSYDDWEHLLALEEEVLQELQLEALESAALEAEFLESQQHEADCELWEHHACGGAPCPLCLPGQLDLHGGMLCCSDLSCSMRIPMMDEAMCLEDAIDHLGAAEIRHRQTGCSQRACFEATAEFGLQPSLYLRCDGCGFR